MARLPMFVAFAVRRAANATIAAGKAIRGGMGLLLVGGTVIAAWVFRANLRRLARRMFSDGWTLGPLDWALRVKAKRAANKGARKQLGEAHQLYSKNHGRAGGR